LNDDSVSMKVLEFGNSVDTSLPTLSDEMPKKIREILVCNKDDSLDFLQYFKRTKVLKEEFGKGPVVDRLGRFDTWYWRSSVAVWGYDELEEHFACQENHVPKDITLKWIFRLFKLWRNRIKSDRQYERDFKEQMK
jgi:hypothetical protein